MDLTSNVGAGAEKGFDTPKGAMKASTSILADMGAPAMSHVIKSKTLEARRGYNINVRERGYKVKHYF